MTTMWIEGPEGNRKKETELVAYMDMACSGN